MANNNRTFLLLVLIFDCLVPRIVSAKAPDKIPMIVGENRTIAIPDALRVHVTRKGIIHLVHEYEDQWSLTAIKSGVVAIEIKSRQQEPRVIYVDVRPRDASGRRSNSISYNPAITPCERQYSNIQYEIQTTVEMVDTNDHVTSGSNSDLSFSWSPSQASAKIGLESSPHQTQSTRQIIGDPIITTRPCDDFEIRAGGEDEIETKTEQGHIVSAWKPHGLSINMKLIPVSLSRLRIPFSVALKSPSRNRGAYGLSEISSSIDLRIGVKTLAATINLSSASSTERDPIFITRIPIIGPLFRNKADSKSASKLLVWLEAKPKKD